MKLSDSLRFEKFTADDYEIYHEMVSDERITRYIVPKPMTRRESKSRYKMVMDQTTRDASLGYFWVYDGDSRVGLAKLVKYNAHDHELGYAFLPQFWGLGLGTEVVRAFVEYSKSLGIPHLTAVVDPRNNASSHLLKKFGFILERKGNFKGAEACFYGLSLD